MAMDLNWCYNSASNLTLGLGIVNSVIKTCDTETEAKGKITSLNRVSRSNELVENLLRLDSDIMLAPFQRNIGSLTGGNVTGVACPQILQNSSNKWDINGEALWYPINYATGVKTVMKQLNLHIVDHEDKVLKDIMEEIAGTRDISSRGFSGAIKNISKWYMSLNTAQRLANAFAELGYYDEQTHIEHGLAVGFQFNPSQHRPTISDYTHIYQLVSSDFLGSSVGEVWHTRGLNTSQLLTTALGGASLNAYDFVKFNMVRSTGLSNTVQLYIDAFNFDEDTIYTLTQGAYTDTFRYTPSSADNVTGFYAYCEWNGVTQQLSYVKEDYSGTSVPNFMIGKNVRDSGGYISCEASTLFMVTEAEFDVEWIEDDPAKKIATYEAHNITTMYPNLSQIQLHAYSSIGSYPTVNYIEMPLDVSGALGEAYWQVRYRDWQFISSVLDEPIDDPPTPTPPYTPDPPDTPSPSENPNKLFAVHTIDDNNISTLGSYLWSETFISLIENMFTTPIQSILGMHVLHYGGSIPVGGSEAIKLGSITSPASGNPVTNRYFTFSCGSVAIPEHYHNVADYKGFTSATLFLPYIGAQEIDINQIMGQNIKIDYGIDAYTGSCVARVYSHNGQSEIGNYYGQCGVQLPVTSADYSNLITGSVKGVIGGAMGGLAGGLLGAIGGGILGGIGGAVNSGGVNIQKANGFNNNVGPLTRQKPRLLLQRANSYEASSFNKFYGYPTNINTQLSQVSGYTRVKSIHLDGGTATDLEKTEIVTLLRQGVII